MAAENCSRTAKRGPGRRFPKGQSGNPKGRPRGARNRATLSAKVFAESVLHDPAVQARILDDARRGRLAPQVLTLLMAYAWGKPKEHIELQAIEELRITITDEIGDDPTSAPAEVVPLVGRTA
jgi:hypothetical protein